MGQVDNIVNMERERRHAQMPNIFYFFPKFKNSGTVPVKTTGRNSEWD